MMGELQLERVLTAPVPDVFKAWTSQSALKEWHCGTISNAIMNVETGGEYRIDFEADENCDVSYVGGTYQEVVPDKKLVYSWKWDTTDCVSKVAIDFEPHERGTLVRLKHSELETDQLVNDHQQGWEQCLDGLKSYLNRSTETLKPPGT